jgi:REP element-mobilizing transposase RayT
MVFRFFDPREDIEEVAGNLPHWRQDGALYFVTFRAADALPVGRLRQWGEEKSLWLAVHPEPWDQATRLAYLDLFPGRIQEWLDANAGECLLAKPSLRRIVESCLRHFDRRRYELDALVVAPNHVHALVAPAKGVELSTILHSWKSYAAKEINQATGRQGAFWQQESYDHIVRGEVALHRIREYIRNHRCCLPPKSG